MSTSIVELGDAAAARALCLECLQAVVVEQLGAANLRKERVADPLELVVVFLLLGL